MTNILELTEEWVSEIEEKYDESEGKGREQELENSIIPTGIQMSKTYITWSTLQDIEEWKWGRRRGLVKLNEESYVNEVTRISMATSDERLKLEILTLLKGVGVPMASSILFFFDRENFTVLDWRSWESLQKFGKIPKDRKITYSFEDWKYYNKLCNTLSRELSVELRALDKALWYRGK